MLDKLFQGILLRITVLVVCSGIGMGTFCGLRSYDESFLLVWAASLQPAGSVSGPVGAIIGRLIGKDFGTETLGTTIGLALGLLFGLTFGVLVSRCLFEQLQGSWGWNFRRSWNVGGLIGGLLSGGLVGVIASFLATRKSA
jgi:zinc transporter ZupT